MREGSRGEGKADAGKESAWWNELLWELCVGRESRLCGEGNGGYGARMGVDVLQCSTRVYLHDSD